MATPPSAAKFADLLRDEGLTVHEVGNWETHNRAGHGAWGPLNGVMIHHTATSGTSGSVEVCREGRSDLPGPLCHGVIDKKGEVWLVGYGRANHAGLGDDDVLRAVINETALPARNENNTDGNARFYGFECINQGNGKDPWPKAQLLAIEKVSAAICRHHGWSERSVIGHLEWQVGKVDPKGFTMSSMRTRIGKRIATKAPGKTTTPSKPSTPTTKIPKFPGAKYFKTGANNAYVTQLGKQLVKKGYGTHYTQGPGPKWSEADRQNVAAFQRAHKQLLGDPDGYPGPLTWKLLFT